MCAVILRTWRLRPSYSVIFSQQVGIALRSRIGGVRGHSHAGSGTTSAPAGNAGPSLRVMPLRRRINLIPAVRLPPERNRFCPVRLPAASAAPAVRHHGQNQPFAVAIETACGIHLAHRHKIFQRAAASLIAELRRTSKGLLKSMTRRGPFGRVSRRAGWAAGAAGRLCW